MALVSGIRLLVNKVSRDELGSISKFNNYRTLDVLSSSQFNKVYLAANASKSLVVIKEIQIEADLSQLNLQIENTSLNTVETIDITSSTSYEINILRNIAHTNVARLIDVFCNTSDSCGSSLLIGMLFR